MRLIVFYDLPFYNEAMVKEYNNFRKELFKNGFHMMQFSIYSKTCPNEDAARNLNEKIKKIVPNNGNIRTLIITEKQYQRIEILRGKKSMTEEILDYRKLIIL